VQTAIVDTCQTVGHSVWCILWY